ncbi:hypothetical protein C8R47DRAFT_1081341 [Mycena vitilis]|nr:hypothetical protein C8R47DRAFT_1081341 [Mycena vitilis]
MALAVLYSPVPTSIHGHNKPSHVLFPTRLQTFANAGMDGCTTAAALAPIPPTPTTTFAKAALPPLSVAGFTRHDTSIWSYLTTCVCLAAWMVHNPLDEVLGSLSAPVAAPSLVPSGPSAPAVPTLPASGLRFGNWGGLPAVVRGNVQSRRIASAERTLPQHSEVSSSAPTSAQSPRRGARNSFPGPSRTSGSSSSTRASSSTSTQAHSGVFSNTVTVTAALYPLVDAGQYEIAGHPTVQLVLKNADIVDFLNRLDEFGLLLSLTVPRQGLASVTNRYGTHVITWAGLATGARYNATLTLPDLAHVITCTSRQHCSAVATNAAPRHH